MATKKTTKAERRAAAQARAEQLRKAQQAKERRTRLGIIIGAVALVALIAVAGVMIFVQASKPLLESVEVKPANSDNQGGFTVLADDKLAPVTNGQATGAKGVVLDVYYDYMCHWCAAFENLYLTQIDEMRTSGELTVVLHPLNMLSNGVTSPSDMAGMAAAEVADKDPDHFYAFHEGLFTWQYQQMGKPTDKLVINQTAAVSYTASDLTTIAKEAGVSQQAIAAFGSTEYETWLTKSKQQAVNNAPKLTGTPALYLRQAGKPFSDAKVWQPSYTDLTDLKTAVADVAAGKNPPPASTATAVPVPDTTPSISQGTPSPTATK